MKQTLFIIILVSSILFHCYGVPENGWQTGDTVKKAVPKNWKIGGMGNLTFSQAYLSYWVEGGENSISTLNVLDAFANYSKGSLIWENSVELKYGLLKSGDKQSRKNEDKIELNSKLGWKAFKSLYYSLLLNFKTQGFKGYNYPTDTTKVLVSDFFAPAYLILSLGIDCKPADYFSVMISPITSRTTFVKDGGKINDSTLIPGKIDQTQYGLKTGKNSKEEMGAYIKTMLKLNVMKNVQITNRLDLFSDYLHNPQNINVNWEVNLAMKINKYLVTTVNTMLLYDDNINIPVPNSNPARTTKNIQFKEVLGVGFSYLF